MANVVIKGRIKSIEMLRAFGIIAVLLFHFFPRRLEGGYLGVDLFFVISGFVITGTLVRYGKFDFRSYLIFLMKRFWRLYPALAVLVIFVTILFLLLYASGLRSTLMKGSASALLFFSNLYFGSNANYFDIISELMPLLHTWSLSIEWQFYIFFPIIYIATEKNSLRCAAIALLCISSCLISDELSISRPTLNFFGLQSRAWEFTAGALAFHFFMYRTTKKVGMNVFHVVAVLVLTLIIIAYFFLLTDYYPAPSFITIPFVFASVMLIYFGAIYDSTISKFIPNFLVYIGGISYSIYLVHYPFVAYAKYTNLSDNWRVSMIPIVVLLSVILSKTVEMKFRYFSSNRGITIVLSASSLFVLLVFNVYSKDIDVVTQYSNYVQDNFNKNLLVDKKMVDSLFETSNVLIVGDSFAQDMTNILVENGTAVKYGYDTHFISQQCGNLFVPKDGEYISHIPEPKRLACTTTENYDTIKNLLKDYKIIFLSSNWTNWQVEYLPHSLENIRNKTDALIVVVGTKGIGKVNPYAESNIPIEQKLKSYGSSPQSVTKTNEGLKRAIASLNDELVYFMDINSILCPATNRCIKYTADGKLISYDGGHLTKEGASFISQRIKLPSY